MKKVFKKGRKSKEKDHACLNRKSGCGSEPDTSRVKVS